MTNEETIEMLEYIKHVGNGESEYKNDAQAIAIDMAIKALSEPTIPLSVIEKITTEIEERATYEGIYLDRADVLDTIDKAVKECTHE